MRTPHSADVEPLLLLRTSSVSMSILPEGQSRAHTISVRVLFLNDPPARILGVTRAPAKAVPAKASKPSKPTSVAAAVAAAAAAGTTIKPGTLVGRRRFTLG